MALDQVELAISAVRHARVKALEDILGDNAFWHEQKAAWHEAMAPLARTIFDEGLAFGQTIRPRLRRRGARGFTDRLFGRKADFLDADPEILDNIASRLFGILRCQ